MSLCTHVCMYTCIYVYVCLHMSLGSALDLFTFTMCVYTYILIIYVYVHGLTLLKKESSEVIWVCVRGIEAKMVLLERKLKKYSKSIFYCPNINLQQLGSLPVHFKDCRPETTLCVISLMHLWPTAKSGFVLSLFYKFPSR